MEKWERQTGESFSAYEAFRVYLDKRNLREVAAALKKNQSLIKRWSSQNNWRERADAWDNEISRRAIEKAATDFAAIKYICHENFSWQIFFDRQKICHCQKSRAEKKLALLLFGKYNVKISREVNNHA